MFLCTNRLGAPQRRGGHGHTLSVRHPPPAPRRVRRQPLAAHSRLSAFCAAHTEPAGAGTLRHHTRHPRLRIEHRSGRYYQDERHRRLGRPARAHRRTATICRSLRSSAGRHLSDHAGRPRGGGQRPRLGHLWQQCHGRRGEHRDATDEGEWRAHQRQPARWQLRHLHRHGHQPRATRALLINRRAEL